MFQVLTTTTIILSLFIHGSIGNNQNTNKNNKNNNAVDSVDSVDSVDEPTIELHNSCIDLEDGMYYIKPTEDGQIIPVICSSYYTMIDISLNFDAITSYFNTWSYSKSDTYIIGPELDDYSSWREWWSLSDDTTQFRVAANCHKCYADDFGFGDNSAYYMSSYYFCFSTAMFSECDYNEEANTYTEIDGFPYACAYCDDGTGHNDEDIARIWSKCTSLRFDADTKPDTAHYGCVTHSLLYRPSAVTNRDACTCYKPSNKKTATTYIVPISDLPPVTIPDTLDPDTIVDPSIIIATDDIDTEDSQFPDGLDVIYLSQSDVLDGTYRITTPGEYILSEDIIFNFNPPPADIMNNNGITNIDWSPNSYDNYDLYWYPKHEQQDKYPGLYTYHSKFTLGFFAGISIECNDVIINLNGFSLSMDYTFYFQQRFFSLIELGNQPFLAGQGPANWGSDQVFASNVIIKDGTLGLSSHHSIHGNQNNNILVDNVRMTLFDVAGMGCNACNQVTVNDCVIGPQNTNIPVLGRYTHARVFIPRLKELVADYGDSYMSFYNRDPIKVSDLADRLINQMDMIYFHFINGIEYDDETDEEWIAAKKLFYNPSGWMDGGSSYGLVLNGDGAAVVGIGCRTSSTSDITLNNVEIYGIYDNPIEKPKFQSNGAIRLSFFDGLDWPAVTDQLTDLTTSVYIGDAYTDLVFTVNYYIESWYYLNSLRITPAMSSFVLTGDSQAFADEYEGICGSDIQLHSSKGAIGLRIDGVQNININNLYVHDIQNWGNLGIDLCGEYHYPTVSHEDPQIQYGYTGNRAQGIIASYASGSMTGIRVENVESYYGSAWGVVLYKGNEFEIEDIAVKSIYAGTQLTADIAQSLVLPNLTPLACSVEIRDEAIITSSSGNDNFEDIIGTDVTGHKLCDNPTNNYGDLLGVCDENCVMYDGDTMSGSSGSGSGGDREETAPVAVDAPSLVLDSTDDTEFVDVPIPDGSIGISSACNYLEDGLNYILPYGIYDAENAPLLPVICNDGNTILDVSFSFDRYSKYFTSLYMYDVGIAGPVIDDFNTWRQWYLPLESSDSFKYGVSDNCDNTCVTDQTNEIAYYMTGNFYLCAWITKGDCDMDAETYECYVCSRNGGRSSSVYPGVCSHVAINVDYEVHDDHFQCTGSNDNLKPAIGLQHQFCVCYNPLNENLHESYIMNEDDYNTEITKLQTEMEETRLLENPEPIADDGSNNIVYLSNEDFLYGTYRITSPGIYILSEDILINFNSPSDEIKDSDTFSPNSYYDLYWMPQQDGSQDDEYMGASTWSGPYQLGFFSAITIECSNVIIDLNSFEIGMSNEFYLQQRVFSIFELASKNFVAGQGPVDFGPYLNSGQNVIIKNGIIGRASHHGIHANDAKGVTLQDLKIYNFDVAGIQLNGFDDITIQDCEIGPSASNIPVTGRYLHARVLLRRYQHLVDNYGDQELTFANRDTLTVRDYVDELIEQMDMVYNNYINNYEYEEDDEQWLRVKDLFLNPNINGYGDGGVVYGILLNSRGGAVMGFGNAPSQSTNAVINNVYIHDLAISPIEKLKFKTNPLGGATRGPVADVMDLMKVSDQWDDVSSANYIGTAYSDVQIAMSLFEKSWYVLDHTCFDDGIISWAVDGVPFGDNYYGGCNTDIQLHINKGVIGLRIDNIVGFQVSNVQIENLVNTGNLGTETEVCGSYSQGNAHQDPLITAGYTGTEGYGITVTQSTGGQLNNININNLETYYGMANGIALFKDSSVDFNTININNIAAGSHMLMEYLHPDQNYLPNKIPIACSVFDNQYNTEYTLSGSINAENINGYLICNDNSMIGDCDDDTCIAQYDQSYFDDLTSSYASIKHKNNKKLTYSQSLSESIHNHSSSSSLYKLILIIISIIIILLFLIYHFFFNKNYLKIKDNINNKKLNDSFASENTPLLT